MLRISGYGAALRNPTRRPPQLRDFRRSCASTSVRLRVHGVRRPSADRVLPRGSRHLFWSHPRDGCARREDGHALCCCGNSQNGCVTLGVMSTWRQRSSSVATGQGGKRMCPEGQDWQIPRQVSLTQSNGAAEKAVSTVRGLAGTYLAVIKDKISSSEVTTHSPGLPWTIRHLDSHSIQCERRHTNDPVRQDSLTENTEKEPHLCNELLSTVGNRPLAGT